MLINCLGPSNIPTKCSWTITKCMSSPLLAVKNMLPMLINHSESPLNNLLPKVHFNNGQNLSIYQAFNRPYLKYHRMLDGNRIIEIGRLAIKLKYPNLDRCPAGHRSLTMLAQRTHKLTGTWTRERPFRTNKHNSLDYRSGSDRVRCRLIMPIRNTLALISSPR